MFPVVKLASLRNLVVVALLAVTCAFLLVGCGGSSGSKDHSSEWTEANQTAFYAKAEQSLIKDGGSEALAKSAPVKELGECVLEKLEPVYSPTEVLTEKGHEPKKAKEITAECEAKFKTAIQAEAKKLESSSEGSTGATEAESGSTGATEGESESTGGTGATEEEK